MYDTLNTKNAHYANGYHCVGHGPEVIVILGSCRVLPFVNYIDQLNADGRFSIVLINVVNFSFDQQDQQVDGIEFTKQFEINENLLETLKRCKIFIHEHTANYGCFNTDRQQEKNIYQFGMSPEIDISIPNFHNIFILFQELVDLDAAVRDSAKQDIENFGALSEGLQSIIKDRGLKRIQDFLDICAKTDLPEFGAAFSENWRTTRYWWTGNHVSREFTEKVFALMSAKFLHLDLTPEFWKWCEGYNPYSTPCTRITKYDVEAFGLNWPQPVEELNI